MERGRPAREKLAVTQWETITVGPGRRPKADGCLRRKTQRFPVTSPSKIFSTLNFQKPATKTAQLFIIVCFHDNSENLWVVFFHTNNSGHQAS